MLRYKSMAALFVLSVLGPVSVGCSDDSSGSANNGNNGNNGNNAEPCAGVDCSGHGTCNVVDGAAQCSCEDGYHVVDATSCE
ncbi:MAG: hypothetical protein J7M25_08260, partial [Deltaproteobacteria bacterium]|nr:hypothetical protein [Deltaproteobacteria bacterium]